MHTIKDMFLILNIICTITSGMQCNLSKNIRYKIIAKNLNILNVIYNIILGIIANI